MEMAIVDHHTIHHTVSSVATAVPPNLFDDVECNTPLPFGPSVETPCEGATKPEAARGVAVRHITIEGVDGSTGATTKDNGAVPNGVPNVPNADASAKSASTMTRSERINLGWYIAAIASYKFALETVNVSISLFVLDRLNGAGTANSIWANLLIAYNLCQSLGASLSGPLLRRFSAPRVMTAAVAIYFLATLTFNVIEFVTGGTIHSFGNWNAYGVFPLYIIMGCSLGTIDTVRRTISTFLVGTSPANLKRADALIHIGYEVGGTAGAFAAAVFVDQLGNVYSTGVVAVLFGMACILFKRIQPHDNVIAAQAVQATPDASPEVRSSCLASMTSGVKQWWHSMRAGAAIVFTRQFIWLLPCYVLPLVIHRLYENSIFPFYAKNVLKNGSLSGVMLSASNFGELLGAATVLKFATRVKSPRPYIRLDAISMMAIWSLVYVGYNTSDAWVTVAQLLPLIIPVSFGWAMGDVALLADVQSTLMTQNGSHAEGEARLGSVMSFLYTCYVLLMMAFANIVGVIFDDHKSSNDVQGGMFWVGGIMMSIIAVIIFLSTWAKPSSASLTQVTQPVATIAGAPSHAAHAAAAPSMHTLVVSMPPVVHTGSTSSISIVVDPAARASPNNTNDIDDDTGATLASARTSSSSSLSSLASSTSISSTSSSPQVSCIDLDVQLPSAAAIAASVAANGAANGVITIHHDHDEGHHHFGPV